MTPAISQRRPLMDACVRFSRAIRSSCQRGGVSDRWLRRGQSVGDDRSACLVRAAPDCAAGPKRPATYRSSESACPASGAGGTRRRSGEWSGRRQRGRGRRLSTENVVESARSRLADARAQSRPEARRQQRRATESPPLLPEALLSLLRLCTNRRIDLCREPPSPPEILVHPVLIGERPRNRLISLPCPGDVAQISPLAPAAGHAGALHQSIDGGSIP